eukprot:Plantae.Rhodophyta-Purpureofilum_apyrenoidigerum.ctg42428.p1 GENE.Plantae.Rhodophyta-Purpureofilum_apyrenoidigerum.ctg42428~~Plantae.Rhodophyta-Purpureofilum_apyrenoidigerum.ctg42428.p1  ORF type:complete len:371 (+),score=82.86 Plantae.Rhodophyta-Purpureofilum_apyrenoidigerum.ctg42428:96-1115(+)
MDGASFRSEVSPLRGTLSQKFAMLCTLLVAEVPDVVIVNEPVSLDGVEKRSGLELAHDFSLMWREAMAAGCISMNETVEDMATKDIKYVLIPYYNARALQSAALHSVEERSEAAKMTHIALTEFLDLVRTLELAKKEDLDAATKAPPRTSADYRSYVIRLSKLTTSQKAHVAELKKRRACAGDDTLDELEREITLAVVYTCVCDTMLALKSIEQERELLKFAVESRQKGLDPSEEARKAVQNLVPPQTYRIIDTRQYQQEQVFRPSHTMPTYTVEQWGDIEAARMRENTVKEAEQKKQREAEEQEDSDDDEVSDRKTMEARRWADWTDDNNKGSGNTLR